MRNVVLLLGFLLCIYGCKEPPKEPSTQSRQNVVELRMVGAANTGNAKFLLSTEFRKISSGIARAMSSGITPDDNHGYVSIDSTGTALSSRLFMESDPEKIIAKLNDCFFNQMGIEIDKKKESLDNTLPDKIYVSKKATVAGACMLMLLLGEKADIPLVCVKIKNHYFVRFDNGKVQVNIELQKGGVSFPDSWYTLNYGISEGDDGKLQQLTSSEASAVLYYSSSVALLDSNTEYAMLGFARALEKLHGYKEAQYQLDLLVDKNKDSAKMLEQLINMRVTYPELEVLDKSLALLYFRTGNYKSAAEYYERALEHSPDQIALVKGAGISYLNLHEYDSAKKYLQKASLAAPSDSQVSKWLSECP